MLEDLVHQTFSAEFSVKAVSTAFLTSEKRYPKNLLAALLVLSPDPWLIDKEIRKLLRNYPLIPVICLNDDASAVKIFSLELSINDQPELSIESIADIIRNFQSWYRNDGNKLRMSAGKIGRGTKH